MRKRSFTSSFNSFWESPLAIVALAIILIEASFSIYERNTGRFAYHSLDQLMRKIDLREYRAPVLLIGDSVLPSAVHETRPLPVRYFNDLTENQAIEMPGQYFLVQRFLERNPAPKTVVFIGLNPFGQEFDMPWTETFIKRVFTRPSEIIDLFIATRDLKLAAGMALYGAFPTHRYRATLTGDLGYPKATDFLDYHPEHSPSHSILAWLGALIQPKPLDLSRHYFEKLMTLLEARKIPFLFLHAGMSEARYSDWKNRAYFTPTLTVQESLENLEEYLHSLEALHPSFHAHLKPYLVYPDEFFTNEKTSVHFNAAGAPIYRRDLLRQLSTTLQIDPASLF